MCQTSRLTTPSFWLAGLLALLPLTPAAAQQALVRSYENPGQTIGQAYLTRYADQCIALLPVHVATQAGIPAFLGEGNGKLGESTVVEDLGDDIGVSEVSGALSRDCGQSMSTISRAVDTLVHTQGLATLRSVNGEASLANMSVTIIDNDGRKYLRVRPTSDSVQIQQGDSGSLLMVGDRPVGMLLKVDNWRGVGIGIVLRFDTLLERAESYLAQQRHAPTPAGDTGDKSGTDLAAAANGGHVSGWNTLAVDSDHRPDRLVAAGTEGYWRARVKHWPAEVDLDLAGGKVAISHIELDASDIPVPERPGRVEIFINTSSEEPRWRSLLGRTVDYDAKGRGVFTFAPTWARQVRIRIGNAHAATDAVSLRRIHVSRP